MTLNKDQATKIAMPLFLRLMFLLNLRKSWSKLVRKVQDERQRDPITKYLAPGELEKAMEAFQYRKDPVNGSVDYVSHPEYVQWCLNNPTVTDGDCDDGHWYVANALKMIPDVEAVYLMSCGWGGPKRGGHATAVYKYHGSWYHFDWGIHPIDDPNNAPKAVAERYGGPGTEVLFWVWESVGEVGNDDSGWQLLAVSPETLKI